MGPKATAKDGDVGIVADADRRRAPRVLVDLEVDYASEENYLFAYITDISATGIFVRTTTPEQPGTHLNLRFQVPDECEGAKIDERGGRARVEVGGGAGETARASRESIEVEGEVIWVNPYRPGAPDNLHPGMGIRFVELDDDTRVQLLELIRRFAYLDSGT